MKKILSFHTCIFLLKTINTIEQNALMLLFIINNMKAQLTQLLRIIPIQKKYLKHSNILTITRK